MASGMPRPGTAARGTHAAPVPNMTRILVVDDALVSAGWSAMLFVKTAIR